jgi:hypothetical protein
LGTRNEKDWQYKSLGNYDVDELGLVKLHERWEVDPNKKPHGK